MIQRRSMQQSNRPMGPGNESAPVLDELQAMPEYSGQEFTARSSGTTYVVVPHNLGRWYRGVQLWGQDIGATSVVVDAVTPEKHKSVGENPARTFGLTTTSVVDVTVRGKVF